MTDKKQAAEVRGFPWEENEATNVPGSSRKSFPTEVGEKLWGVYETRVERKDGKLGYIYYIMPLLDNGLFGETEEYWGRAMIDALFGNLEMGHAFELTAGGKVKNYYSYIMKDFGPVHHDFFAPVLSSK